VIYLHVPFCKSFCTYCDFYSEISSGEDSRKVQNLYWDSVLAEISSRESELKRMSGLSPDTLYVGGGTPSVLPLEIVTSIVNALKDALGDAYRPYEEFTVEVNPEDIVTLGPEYVKGLLNLGVNRVSMGVQSLDDEILSWMNRRHDAEGALKAFDILRDSGLENISIDLIFGISHMGDELWLNTLEKVVELRPEHISSYQLSIEEGSALCRKVRLGEYKEADEELCRRQYSTLCSVLGKYGYEHYEISNFALPGKRAIHNSGYWKRYPYVGLGPAAHSFDGQVRSWNSESLSSYKSDSEILSREDEKVEKIMLALRTSDGIPFRELRRICEDDICRSLIHEGALELSSGIVRIPESHFFVSDEIIRRLI